MRELANIFAMLAVSANPAYKAIKLGTDPAIALEIIGRVVMSWRPV